jgi:hypothetical protein
MDKKMYVKPEVGRVAIALSDALAVGVKKNSK